MQPTNLERTDDGLRITWSDGQVRQYTAGELRKACPCATCREKHGAPAPPANMLPVLSPEEARPLSIQGMRSAGGYAYAIKFSDGHGSGLYQFDLLRELGEAVDA
ncbi:hypothetical protein KOR34_34190 [Posidoniimonas corsicana]|uniref:Gamma-butyrobetaine hydroxylase-like N-terminal domain-containing protein n=1 Tax=Posidoniimonas corsicana TaxID=1938618 RepID=A0A5C5V709_9BACT|nr:DUF971 domain-containing protein [Posidoniimonas corsicana]TWT33587.1 hypothetical protein KOR34_34190 [Posidoniimonas corsicana]